MISAKTLVRCISAAIIICCWIKWLSIFIVVVLMHVDRSSTIFAFLRSGKHQWQVCESTSRAKQTIWQLFAAADLAVKNNTHTVEMPAHTSIWLQPYNRSPIKPLKDYYRSSAQELISQFPGIITCYANFSVLFAAAWTNISPGFQWCGIYPFDPSAIPFDAYLPNYLHTVEEITANPYITDEQHTSELVCCVYSSLFTSKT